MWQEPRLTTSIHRPLVFYVGSIPLLSLVYTTSHLAALQFNGLPTPPYPNHRSPDLSSPKVSYDPEYAASSTLFILAVSVLHFLAWFAQSILCTSCELAPILAGTQGVVPRWCPQSRFRDTGKPALADMLGTLATAKDFLQWGIVLLTILLIECARREYMRADHVRRDAFRQEGAGVDFGGPSRGVPDANYKTPGVELATISGPRLFRPGEDLATKEEELRWQQQAEVEENKKRQKQDASPVVVAAPQPTGPGAPGNKDNYYGNGGLKRSGTLNHMYESRV